MKISRLFFVLFLGVLLFSSCSENNDIPINPSPTNPQNQPYANGFFVLNEGQFPNAGSVTFVANNLDSVEQDVYQHVNNGEDVGGGLQSMFFDDKDRAYIVSNVANFVTVVDRYTFKKEKRITGTAGDFNTPRYGVTEDDKAYITNAGTNHLTVVDLNSLTVEKTIKLDGPSEYILEGDNGLLYVQEAIYNTGNKIAVIDPQTGQVIDTIITAPNLNSIAVEGIFLYALTPHKIQKFDIRHNNTEIGSVALNYADNAANITVEDNMLYYTVGNKAYKISTNATTAPTTPVLTYSSNSPYGMFYGFAVEDNRIYVSDGGDFSSNSYINVYDLQGNLLKTIGVGIGPNGFYFND